MACLVRQGTAQIHRGRGTPGEGGVTNDDAIVLGIANVVGRESGVAEETICGLVIERNGVDVEGV